jgi:hypothetical protein
MMYLIILLILFFLAFKMRFEIEKNEQTQEVFLFYYSISSNFTERKFIKIW